MSALPSFHALAVLILVVGALYAFSREQIPLQTTGFTVLLLLTLGFYVFPYSGVKVTDFFSTFGNEALVTVCALLVLVKGLEITGALQPLAQLLGKAWQWDRRLALAVTLLLAAGCSAFINDVPLMAILLPTLLACAVRSRTSPSRLLLPVNYAVLIGGMASTIGTSTNLLAVSVARDLGVAPLRMFDLAPPVLIAGSIGLVFVWLAAPRLLPEHPALMGDTLPRLFSAALHINSDSYANGRTVSELRARTQNRLRIDRIQRGEGFVDRELDSLRLQAGDRLFLKDNREHLKEFEKLLGATLYNAGDLERPVSELVPLATRGQQLAEVVITRASPLYQRVLRASDFLATYQLLPLALHRGRAAERVISEAPEVRLRSGDVVLVQGSREAVNNLRGSGDTLVLDGAVDLPHTDRALAAFTIFVVVVASHATGLIPISIGALIGVAAMLVTRCLRWGNITQALNINLIMIIVASLCLQVAMTRTGADAFIGQLISWPTHLLPVPLLLGSVMLVVVLLTNFVTANAAAVISMPVGISIARQLELPVEAFVMAIIYAANMPFASPGSFQTSSMIRGAGRYAPADYRRIGIPLTALMLVALTWVLSWMYQL